MGDASRVMVLDVDERVRFLLIVLVARSSCQLYSPDNNEAGHERRLGGNRERRGRGANMNSS